MDTSLIPIKGIGVAMESKLIAEGIPDIPALLEKAATPESRSALAAKLKVNEKLVYSWVKQSELMRVRGMNVDAADLLVKIGVRDVEDLSRVNSDAALQLMKSFSDNASLAVKEFPTKAKLTDWKNFAVTMKPVIVRDPGEPAPIVVPPPALETPDMDESPVKRPVNEDYFYDMGDVISSVGRGIAEAQHALDMSAIMTQQQINKDEDLMAWGLSAHWYTIPEATVNLKMSYQFSNERVEDGSLETVKKGRLLVSPVNAKYTNTFKVSQTMQSELNLKFLPIPPPARWTEQIIVPDFSGLTLVEIREALRAVGMKLGNVEIEEGVAEDDGVTVFQSPPEGARAWLTDKVEIRLGAPEPDPDAEFESEHESDTEQTPEPDPDAEFESEHESGTEQSPEPDPVNESEPEHEPQHDAEDAE